MLSATRLLFVLLLPLMWPLNSWALPADIQTAKDEGMRLYNIGHSTVAMPYLHQAADAGDVEAMYYMDESERRQKMMGFTTAAMKWYLKAAEQGDPYAMLRLFQGGACIGGECPEGSDDWREAALDITLPKAEVGDLEAMLAMYYIYANLDASRLTSVYNFLGIPTRAVKWLKRAAEAGLPEAQTTWGRRIMQASTPLVIHGLLEWLAATLPNTPNDEARAQWREDLYVLNHVAETNRSPLVMIVEEVGRGIVPMEQSQRRLRDVNGWLCQDAASRAEQVWYVRHGLVQTVHK